MSSSISLTSNMETAIRIDTSGQKTEASLTGGKAAKFTYSSSDVQMSEETSIPSGTEIVLNKTDFQWAINYKPANQTAQFIGVTDADMGISVKIHTVALDSNDFYLQLNGSGNIVLTVV